KSPTRRLILLPRRRTHQALGTVSQSLTSLCRTQPQLNIYRKTGWTRCLISTRPKRVRICSRVVTGPTSTIFCPRVTPRTHRASARRTDLSLTTSLTSYSHVDGSHLKWQRKA